VSRFWLVFSNRQWTGLVDMFTRKWSCRSLIQSVPTLSGEDRLRGRLISTAYACTVAQCAWGSWKTASPGCEQCLNTEGVAWLQAVLNSFGLFHFQTFAWYAEAVYMDVSFQTGSWRVCPSAGLALKVILELFMHSILTRPPMTHQTNQLLYTRQISYYILHLPFLLLID
jgi:hypothetical protein